MRKTVIFDMDGTLLNTLEDLWRSVNAMLSHFGFPQKSLDEVRMAVGNGVRNLMREVVPDGEDNPKYEECLAWYSAYYQEHLNDHTGPYPGVPELLKNLAEKGYRLAIVSNKGDQAVKELNRSMFGDVIPVAIGETKQIRRKPAPDTVFEAMRVLGVSPEDCIYIGDSEVDIATAKNCGIPAALVSWGFRGRRRLEELGAELIFDSAEDLLTYLTKD